MALFEGADHVVHISTNIGKTCEHCTEWIGANPGSDHRLADSINHYIEAHGYRLLHVGSETSHGMDGKPWHSTVAVVGK